MSTFVARASYDRTWLEQYEGWFSSESGLFRAQPVLGGLEAGRPGGEVSERWAPGVDRVEAHEPVEVSAGDIADSSSSRPLDTPVGRVDLDAVAAMDEAGLDHLADLITNRLAVRLNMTPTESESSSADVFARSEIIDGYDAKNYIRLDDVYAFDASSGEASPAVTSAAPPPDMVHSTSREPLDAFDGLSHGQYQRAPYVPDESSTGKSPEPVWSTGDFIYAPSQDSSYDVIAQGSSDAYELVLVSLFEPETFSDDLLLDAFEFGTFNYDDNGIAYISSHDDFT